MCGREKKRVSGCFFSRNIVVLSFKNILVLSFKNILVLSQKYISAIAYSTQIELSKWVSLRKI